MWVKKINDYFESSSEYDNIMLSLHFAIDFVEVLKERVEFEVKDDLMITILPYEDELEKLEVDEGGFLYWCQFTFHKELIDTLLNLKQDVTNKQTELRQIQNTLKTTSDDDKKKELNSKVGELAKASNEIESNMEKVDGYRQNIFEKLKDVKTIKLLLEDIKILKEYS